MNKTTTYTKGTVVRARRISNNRTAIGTVVSDDGTAVIIERTKRNSEETAEYRMLHKSFTFEVIDSSKKAAKKKASAGKPVSDSNSTDDLYKKIQQEQMRNAVILSSVDLVAECRNQLLNKDIDGSLNTLRQAMKLLEGIS